MSMVHWCVRRSLPVSSGFGWGQAESGSGRAEGVERREGKIKADGTPWVRSGCQALVCTLLRAALSFRRGSATSGGKPSICRVFGGTLALNRRFWPDCRP